MKVEYKFFLANGAFYALAAIVYWFLSHDPTGTTALALTTGLAALVGFYLYLTSRRIGDRPEDRMESDIEEGSGEIGFFSPHSPWPLALGAGAALVALGVVFGYWLLAIGAVTTALAVVGFVFEYYRGSFAH
ncbi:MAG: cytochrome c oxidase subunit 4 [Actinomycetota bacterium]|nr:cytochrome c oxidase subunit 4 [Actinomycetota bacterium]